MAEINIERKKKPVWPWILLLVLVAIIGWVVYEYMNDRNNTASWSAPETRGTAVFALTELPQLYFEQV